MSDLHAPDRVRTRLHLGIAFPAQPEQPYSQHPYQYGYSDPLLHTDRTGQWVDDPGPSSISRACGQIQWDWLRDSSGCASPFLADLEAIEAAKGMGYAKRELDKPCIPYVQFEIVFLDGTRQCVMNLAGMQFGVQLDPALLERIESAPTCLQPVFEVLSNRRIIMRNADDEDEGDEGGGGKGSGGGSGPPSPNGPPQDPSGDDNLELALRLKNRELAIKKLVPESKDFADLKLDPIDPDFADKLYQYMKKAKKIHFDLTGVNYINAPDGILRGPKDLNPLGSTNWELRTVWDDLSLRGKTQFYNYNKPISPTQVLLLKDIN